MSQVTAYPTLTLFEELANRERLVLSKIVTLCYFTAFQTLQQGVDHGTPASGVDQKRQMNSGLFSKSRRMFFAKCLRLLKLRFKCGFAKEGDAQNFRWATNCSWSCNIGANIEQWSTLAFEFEVAKIAVHGAIIKIGNVPTQNGSFRLPGKKALLSPKNVGRKLAVDVTENPMERPKKTKKLVLRQKNGTQCSGSFMAQSHCWHCNWWNRKYWSEKWFRSRLQDFQAVDAGDFCCWPTSATSGYSRYTKAAKFRTKKQESSSDFGTKIIQSRTAERANCDWEYRHKNQGLQNDERKVS